MHRCWGLSGWGGPGGGGGGRRGVFEGDMGSCCDAECCRHRYVHIARSCNHRQNLGSGGRQLLCSRSGGREAIEDSRIMVECSMATVKNTAGKKKHTAGERKSPPEAECCHCPAQLRPHSSSKRK